MNPKSALTSLILLLPIFAQAQSPLYGQCGGIGWTGATTCVSGSTCTYLNDWYSQCLPGTPSTTTIPTTTTPGTSTTDPATTGPLPTTTPGTCPSGSPALTSIPKLPDPFKFYADSSRVTTKAQWQCRREEILQLFQRYELGTLPPKPSSVTGSLNGNTLNINVSDAGKSISFSVSISYPSSGTAPYPAIIAYGFASIPAPAGVAIITYNNDDIAAQANTGSRGQGKFYNLYGSGHSAGALTAWAWGVGRIIDALETTANTRINANKVGVTGCSRNGKGALVAGALEARVALTIPQESGSGGAGSWRISDAMKSSGIDTQTASQIITENVWFSKNFEPYVNQVRNLPFDHHLLAGLVAPRGLLVIDHTGITMAGNHDHCSFPSATQGGDLTAFVNKFLKDQSTNTNIIKTDNSNLGYVETDWVDWTVPTLS